MRGTVDLHLLDSPAPRLLWEVTGLEPEQARDHVRLDNVGVRSTQRVALGDVDGGIVAFTWPGELTAQARYLYDGVRATQLLGAARAGGWAVDMRPQLAFWNSAPAQRLYTNPTIGLEDYVAGWGGPDSRRIGEHDGSAIGRELWPWLVERGYASRADEVGLEPFLRRLGPRPVHVRPGLRLLRCWGRDEVAVHAQRGSLVGEIRGSINQLLVAVDDRPLQAR